MQTNAREILKLIRSNKKLLNENSSKINDFISDNDILSNPSSLYYNKDNYEVMKTVNDYIELFNNFLFNAIALLYYCVRVNNENYLLIIEEIDDFLEIINSVKDSKYITELKEMHHIYAKFDFFTGSQNFPTEKYPEFRFNDIKNILDNTNF